MPQKLKQIFRPESWPAVEKLLKQGVEVRWPCCPSPACMPAPPCAVARVQKRRTGCWGPAQPCG